VGAYCNLPQEPLLGSGEAFAEARGEMEIRIQVQGFGIVENLLAEKMASGGHMIEDAQCII